MTIISKLLSTRYLRCLFFFSVFISTHTYGETARPNIILVLTDDQPYGYLGVTGNDIVDTPNIDALANKGVLFTNAHVSSAICTPSRVSLLLGQYERKHGVNFNSGTSVSAKAWQNSYPVLLRNAGYYTGWVGKNHVPVGKGGYASGLMEKSFDYWFAGHGHLRFYPKAVHSIFSEATADTQIEIVNEGINDFLDTNEHKFEKAVTFLDKRPKNKPFMLSVNFNLPHGVSTSTMLMKPSDDEIYRTKYRDVDIPLPKHYIAKKDITRPKLPKDLLRVEDRQVGYDVVDTPESVKETYIRQLQAMTGIDRLIGNLVNKLELEGIADNTVIIFTSDHGLFMGEQGLGGKSLCYEKTTHVPLIIYDPRLKNSVGKRNALVQSIDIAPTILAMAQVVSPQTMQGENIAPLLTTQLTTKRTFTFSENLWSTHFGNPRCEAIQDNNWKYIRYYENNNLSASKKIKLAKSLNIPVGKMLYGVHDNDIALYRSYVEASLLGEKPVYEELYHLSDDPDELVNLADNKQFKSELKRLRAQWQPSIEFARGLSEPMVERYTIDSQLEQSSNVHLE